MKANWLSPETILKQIMGVAISHIKVGNRPLREAQSYIKVGIELTT